MCMLHESIVSVEEGTLVGLKAPQDIKGYSVSLGRPVGTTAEEGYSVNPGRPVGTMKKEGYGVSSEKPVGTTKEERYGVSSGRPVGTTAEEGYGECFRPRCTANCNDQ